jgi:elongation factor G
VKLLQNYRPQDIRNIALVGHGGVGKTTLGEALLHRTGAIARMGSVADATTVADFEPEARAHMHSTHASLLFGTWEGREINIIDTPGHPEFIGHALAALPAVETAVVVVDAVVGVQTNTRRLFEAAGELGLARMVVVNRIDQNLAGLASLVTSLRAELGTRLHCINLPTRSGTDVIDCFDHEAGQADFGSVAEVHREMLESSIEIDDAEVERYFAGQAIDLAALRRCFVAAMVAGHVIPVLFTSARSGVGIEDLLHVLAAEGPSPLSAKPRHLHKGETLVPIPCDPTAPFIGHVFKVTSDPHLGRLAMIRILQGTLDASTAFVAASDKKPRKAGNILKIEGRERSELDGTAYAGDIVALAKLEDVRVDQVLHAPTLAEDYAPVRPRYPKPMLALAIAPADKKDDVKLGAALAQLAEEDPTIFAGQDPDTHELVLRGLGDLHLRIALERLKGRHRIEVTTRPPKVAYKETLSQSAEGHHRHKKQTGGAGQFGEVFLRVEPLERGRGCEFVNAVIGGAIPKPFIASIQKGIEDALAEGTLIGAPVEDVRVTVYDGKTHPVDGKDIAFRTAAKMAFRDAASRARPVVLEPIVRLTITLPESAMGAITADLKNLRGRVLGVETQSGFAVIDALAPLAELGSYSGQLRGMTAGAGRFTMDFSHYEAVPSQVQQHLAAGYQPAAAE